MTLQRCRWVSDDPLYLDYHDREWGVPEHDDRALWEKLILDGFQAGLSWITILRKRPAFRAAFAGFEPEKVALYGSADVERLLGDAGIVRHRGKIEATIQNARAAVELHDGGRSLAGLVWSHEPSSHRAAPEKWGDVEAATAESKALSKELRKNGFRFVGATTMYAAMQSLGVVNDHFAGCEWREVCEKERRRFKVPTPKRGAK
jgi:DNA-3-methyladenine glycosylase I